MVMQEGSWLWEWWGGSWGMPGAFGLVDDRIVDGVVPHSEVGRDRLKDRKVDGRVRVKGLRPNLRRGFGV